MFKYSFKSFSSQHRLTKLFQLGEKKSGRGQGLFPLSVSLIKCRVTCSKGIYGGSDAGTPKLLSKSRKISFSLMWAIDRGSLAPSETFRWRQDWRGKEVSLGWHQRKALRKSGRAAKTFFWDILMAPQLTHKGMAMQASEAVTLQKRELGRGEKKWARVALTEPRRAHKWSSWRVRLHKAACLHSASGFYQLSGKHITFYLFPQRFCLPWKKKKRVN